MPRVFALIFLIGVIGTPVLAHRKNRDVGRWLFASLAGLWMTAGVSFLGILMFSDLQRWPEDERARSVRREKRFCWTMIVAGAVFWLAVMNLM